MGSSCRYDAESTRHAEFPLTLSADTIAAIATPPGRGGVGIVRISGPDVSAIADAILGALPPPRRALLADFRDEDGSVLDRGLALYFPAPRSMTGEAVLELHAHGGPVVLDLLLARVLSLGARTAEPGEFSRRAFMNDKLDLAQAEAIADLIDSGSQQAARAAMRSLKGEFSALVNALTAALIELRVYVEAAMDFPEEDLDLLSDAQTSKRMRDVFARFERLSSAAEQGHLLQHGMTVVIAGRPNAGKSSLLNRLAGYDAAIVTDIPGTTRDVVRERIHLDGMPLHVLDTAGLRADGDVVEREGMRRTRQEMTQADRLLLVVDSSEEQDSAIEELPAGVPVTIVRNKIDLSGEAAGLVQAEPATVALSAKSAAGLDALRQHLKDCMGFQGSDSGTLSARRRHLDALRRADQHAHEAKRQLVDHRAAELMAEELRLAQKALGEITGEFTSEDLLGRIFSSFCIGK